MDTRIIGKLISMMESSNLSILDIEENDFHIRLEKNAVTQQVVSSIQPMDLPPMAAHEIYDKSSSVENMDLPKGDQTQWEEYKDVVSPLVGTFHSLDKIGKNDKIDVGAKVNKGDVVCVIEAMKLMNEIESEFSGEIVQVLVNDGDIVEFGQVLFKIKE